MKNLEALIEYCKEKNYNINIRIRSTNSIEIRENLVSYSSGSAIFSINFSNASIDKIAESVLNTIKTLKVLENA